MGSAMALLIKHVVTLIHQLFKKNTKKRKQFSKMKKKGFKKSAMDHSNIIPCKMVLVIKKINDGTLFSQNVHFMIFLILISNSPVMSNFVLRTLYICKSKAIKYIAD